MINKIKYLFGGISRIIKYLLIYRTFRAVEYIIFEKEKLIYIPIPKCWNTSIKKSLASLITAKELPFWYAVHEIKFPTVLIGRSLPKKYLDWKYLIFTAIRDPLERLISCYYSKYHTDKEKIKNGTFRTDLRYKKLDFDDYLFWYLRKDPGNVENFIKKVLKIPTFLMDNHFRPMTNFIWASKKSIKIIDMKNLDEEFEPIRIKYNLPRLETHNKTSKDKQPVIKGLSVKLIEKIKIKYREDYELYNQIKKTWTM